MTVASVTEVEDEVIRLRCEGGIELQVVIAEECLQVTPDYCDGFAGRVRLLLVSTGVVCVSCLLRHQDAAGSAAGGLA